MGVVRDRLYAQSHSDSIILRAKCDVQSNLTGCTATRSSEVFNKKLGDNVRHRQENSLVI